MKDVRIYRQKVDKSEEMYVFGQKDEHTHLISFAAEIDGNIYHSDIFPIVPSELRSRYLQFVEETSKSKKKYARAMEPAKISK